MFFKKKKIEEEIKYNDISEKMQQKLLTLDFYPDGHYYCIKLFTYHQTHNYIHSLELSKNQFSFYIYNKQYIYQGSRVEQVFNHFFQQYEEKKRIQEEESEKAKIEYQKRLDQFISEHSDHFEDFF